MTKALIKILPCFRFSTLTFLLLAMIVGMLLSVIIKRANYQRQREAVNFVLNQGGELYF